MYNTLLTLKNKSNYLRCFLPKNEREFILSARRENLIKIYQSALYLINNSEFSQDLQFKDLGEAYDFVSKYVTEYDVKKNKIDKDFMEYFISIIREEIKKRKVENNSPCDVPNHKAINLNSSVLGFEQTLTADMKELKEKLLDTEQKTEDYIQRIESGISQLNQSPGFINSNDIVQKSANELIDEIKRSEFDEKFPEYKELNALLIRYNYGIITPKDSQIVEMIINIGNQFYQDFSLDDMLMPYLEEKAHLQILTAEESKIYNSKVGYDYFAAKKLNNTIAIYSYVFFGDDNKVLFEFLKKFEACNRKLELYSSNNYVPTLKEENNIQGPTRK